MSDLDLDAIEARANAATRGPWKMGKRSWPDVVMTPYGCLWNPGTGRINDIEDGEFVAHAREDIPALIARIRQLEADNQDLVNELRELGERDA
ncbi:hypothetical protein SEA_GETALONG_46 [Gordonia phage Getalong]|uniref:Uncharacterized protein n=1 Tax=Gordonia phage Getalong TaxID=2315531 RepID=A0A386KFB5_9CAUD|nr:Ead/Ea22-like protein [Gordonia phage Getalong]AYD83906.1 hypothetical protein SEA_GETALONG_46 [Gordonia phage Getalong]